MKLEALQETPLREIWNREADFTNWLIKSKNLKLLSKEIGIAISSDKTQIEVSVGKFRVDILTQEENSTRKIVIENQFESTDHDHLGKIITYAAGFDAKIIIWIFEDVRDEHRQAIDWLNENTDEKVNFFAIKIELWKIGNSDPAPKFDIIAQPNYWVKALNESKGHTELTIQQFEFWEALNEYIGSRDTKVKTKKPKGQHYYEFSLSPKRETYLKLSVDHSKGFCSVAMYTAEHYLCWEENKEAIESETSLNLEWMEKLPNSDIYSQIIAKKYDFNLYDTEAWNSYHEWLLSTLEKMESVFVKYKKSE